ncbi:MAG: tRNA uridine-5-carboxymethylaminomethyl(34) synthesis GTPase MnmE [Deltaproteobacteria bacterium]|nr:tRNA uridine-5-carboxymethylaminomethyl(34) synthesis GTPase MnmE [Deltaproteobacteria bacterium]
MRDDTIAAIASAAGGGVGVIRLSGPSALAIARARFAGLPAAAAPRRLYLGRLTDAAGATLDEGLCALFPGPASFTGEDVAELHLHGGALSLRACLAACLAAGARHAEPGEFTRRAFLNGKIDLTRAEAVADLVGARTERALAQARAHLGGALAARANAARDALLALRARIEVGIDFVEEDVPLIDPAELARDARAVGADLRALAATHARGRLLRDGARVVLAGRPNAGKSSLFNALLEADRAIVSELPGTTRDVVDAAIDLGGVPVVLVDTAGIRAAADAVEAHGVARSEREVRGADVVVHVIDPADPDPVAPLAAAAEGAPVVRVASKADLHATPAVADAVAVSVVTGEGLDALRDALLRALGGGLDADGTGLVIARERQRDALVRAADALDLAACGLDDGAPAELVAVDVQEALDALAELVGLSTVEDVLDVLFSAFCIGK